MDIYVAIWGNGEEVSVGHSEGGAVADLMPKVFDRGETAVKTEGNEYGEYYDIYHNGDVVDGILVVKRVLKDETISEQLSRTQME